MSVVQLGTLVLVGSQERGVPLVQQASVNLENVEIKAVQADLEFLELPEYLVGMRSA